MPLNPILIEIRKSWGQVGKFEVKMHSLSGRAKGYIGHFVSTFSFRKYSGALLRPLITSLQIEISSNKHTLTGHII